MAVCTGNEQLARSALNCLENFVVSCGAQFSSEIWDKTCQCISEVFTSNMPDELLTWRPEGREVVLEVVAVVHSDSEVRSRSSL